MGNRNGQLPAIESFDFPVGRVLARKYEVVSRLGVGWEGEVYRLRETRTEIERRRSSFSRSGMFATGRWFSMPRSCTSCSIARS